MQSVVLWDALYECTHSIHHYCVFTAEYIQTFMIRYTCLVSCRVDSIAIVDI